MNLADRLRAVIAPQSGSTRESGSSQTPPDRSDPAAGGRLNRCDTPSHLEHALGGEWRDTAGGRSFVVSRRAAPDAGYGHGSVRMLAQRLRRSTTAAPLVSVAAARPPFVFFDLETTGLSGGAGTYAFLVGCGWFDEDDAFVTEQYVLVESALEQAMLRAVGTQLGRAGAIVSFNGKSFDAPVLETRYLFHRMESPCGPLPHVDVLHPARRFWGNEGESSCSLAALERQVLGAGRVGDVAGFEIPHRYFQFVRSGDARPLAAVLEHNRLDLLSLAGLTARLLHLIEDGPAAVRDAREALALGRVYTRAGLDGRADGAFRHALELCDRPLADDIRTAHDASLTPNGTANVLIKLEALRSLALAARRRRQYELAAGRWRELLEVPGCPCHLAREANEALAIHHEHRARDLASARLFALKTLEMQSGGTAAGDAVRHRLARIERKLVSGRRSLFSSPSLPLPRSSGSPMSARRTSS